MTVRRNLNLLARIAGQTFKKARPATADAQTRQTQDSPSRTSQEKDLTPGGHPAANITYHNTDPDPKG